MLFIYDSFADLTNNNLSDQLYTNYYSNIIHTYMYIEISQPGNFNHSVAWVKMAVWVTTTGCYIPEHAIRAGYDAVGRPLFIARASIEDDLTPGKCGFHLQGAHIPYGCKEIVVHQYEVLVHANNASGFYDWQRASRGRVPNDAVSSDTDLYVGRAYFSGGLIPCKIATSNSHMCAYIGYDGVEHSSMDYEVLCKIK